MSKTTTIIAAAAWLVFGAGQALAEPASGGGNPEVLQLLSPKRVFVTADTYGSNLGGLAGADAKCQVAADAADLDGTFMAWLSDGLNSPGTRFITLSIGPYITVDGATVAGGYGDLTDGSLNVLINKTETGAPVGGRSNAWTNTTFAGSSTSQRASETCDFWFWQGASISGHVGQWPLMDRNWTQSGLTSCSIDGHLYCFEQ